MSGYITRVWFWQVGRGQCRSHCAFHRRYPWAWVSLAVRPFVMVMDASWAEGLHKPGARYAEVAYDPDIEYRIVD